MVQVEMNTDIKDFEPKLISIFTKRQLICVIIACVYGIPFMFKASFITDLTTRIIVGCLLMAPVLACGWCKLYGLPLEKFAQVVLIGLILTPRKRKYVTECIYDKELAEIHKRRLAYENKGKKVKKAKKKKINYEGYKPLK